MILLGDVGGDCTREINSEGQPWGLNILVATKLIINIRYSAANNKTE